MDKLTAKFQAVIRAERLFCRRDRILIGVSGGPDSVCLLSLLLYLSKSYHFKLAVAHVNHCLRGKESDADELFVRKLALKCGLPFFSVKEDVSKIAAGEKMSLEDAARKIRYDFFLRVCLQEKINKIALAHSRDDQAETVLMRILRGTGITGLCAMQRKSRLSGISIIRPLLDIEKKEILRYSKQHRLASRIDSSNLERDFFRNKVRLDVLPFLSKFNPQISQNLFHLGENAKEVEVFLQAEIDKAYAKLIHNGHNAGLVMRRDKFLRLAAALRKGVIRRAIEAIKGDLKDIEYKHIQLIEDMAAAYKHISLNAVDLPGNVLIQKNRGKIVFRKKASAVSEVKQKNITCVLEPDKKVEIPKLGYCFLAKRVQAEVNILKHSRQVEYFDADKLRFPLFVRTRRNGDVFHPLGSSGKKKIKKFFIDEKIERQEKESIPLVLSGKTIVWVVGMRIAEPFKITPKTKRIIRITARKLK
ncbi:MAG: tRNA lysidine(34) synthetase TilS [Candidatus Omnitrophica bacterium]|nr:tRNA lysidine(34) synthetase TilS [Candidatus Omnitrophota bacterium]MBU4479061.1 tRNA lysidine(34) synthetase TilS [Candidatus Omnitrophota bacterium]MCG2702768.1 tRNA lysidine(34) synthetase TilS [Candidatus Omnitrophota bacterium]